MKNLRDQRGFVTVMILMLTSVLVIMLGIAMHFLYVVHQQNRQERQKIIQRAATLNLNAPTAVKSAHKDKL